MYSTLRRPKRKLCYISKKECPSEKWADKMSLGDIDKMFDDLEPSSQEEKDELPSTPLLHISNTPSGNEEETSPVQKRMEPQTNEHPIRKSPRVSSKRCASPKLRPLGPELDIGLNGPFKGHGPVKTSSPIEKKSVGDCVEEAHNGGVISPIIFLCDDDTNRCNESDFGSPPQRVALNKCKTTYERDTAQISRQKRPVSPPSAARRRTEAKMPVKKSENVHRQPFVDTSSRADKDATTFLQKLRDATQPKPSRSRKSLTPVKVTSPPPVLEEDFLILEDDETFRISIPSKVATGKRPRRTSSTDKESSADKGANDSALKQPQTDQANNKLEPQTVSQKVKKGKITSSKKNEAIVRGNKVDVPEKLPSCDVKEPPKASKRKQPREVPSKDSDKAEEKPRNTGRRASGGRGKPTVKKENVIDGNDVKTLKSPKVTRKASQDLVHGDAAMAEGQQLDSIGHADVENNKISLEAERQNKHKRGKPPAVSEERFPGDSPIVQKRKRRQPGEWWVSNSQRPEDTDVTDSWPTPKMPKQNTREPKMSLISPVNVKKGGGAKRGNRKQPVQSPGQKAKTQPLKKGNEEKRDKQNNNLNLKGCAPGRRKLFDEVEAEQIEQQEVTDQDSGPLHSSPLILPQQDRNLDPNIQVFQKVHRHVTSEKKSRPAAASPKKSRKRPRPEEPQKRRRRHTSSWWMVKGSSDDVESSSSQPQRQDVKRRKERTKKPKRTKSPGLKTPKNNNLSISPIPLEGAPTPHLGAKPVSAPKTVKRSLATFKEVFTSATETPAVRGRGKATLNNGHMVRTSSAVPEGAGEDDTPTVISMDAGDFKSPHSLEPPDNSKNQSDNMMKSLRSGPSCMIELQQYGDNDEINLPSSRFVAVLAASDLCGPPLQPLTLLPKDKSNLLQWFKSLWSVTADRGPEITPDDFDWYFYRGRAIGIQEDLICDSICNGKLLLGSFMKKPLWVDHSANTVFNLLTSSVKVSINGQESHIIPAQAFMVQSGEAYSIQNLTAQPAVLYFTRIFSETSN